MMNTGKKRGLLMGLAGAALALATPAVAQEAAAPAEAAPTGTVTTSDEIVIPGQITYRNRSEETAPVLEYGLDYFQRFEPLSAGDALKRVPSVAFLSDVGESDGVRLRGLDPAYTQILINGEQVPGSGSSSGAFGNGAEQAFFVDRIPAELIEGIEIVRSASANRSGDALAGAINIKLRDAYSLDGGFIRAGLMYFDDTVLRETLGGVYGGAIGPGRFLIGANLQDRYNPKIKTSWRYDAPGAALNNIENQTDTRDGTDYSLNGSFQIPVFGGEFSIDGVFVHTDRYENEDSLEYQDGVLNNANLLTVNDNNADIEQDSYAINTRYTFQALGGENRLKFSYSRFEANESEYEDEMEFLRDAVAYPEADRYTGEEVRSDLQDEEFKIKVEHERQFGDVTLEVGVHAEFKERENLIEERDPRIRINIANGTLIQGARPSSGLPALSPFAAVAGGDNLIERRRIDPYAQISGDYRKLDWEAGLRVETTETDITDRTVGSSTSDDRVIALPSMHLRWNLTDNDRIAFSVARTVRNPSLQLLSPALLEAELGDNDFVGNAFLEPESAFGVDLGYERRLGRTGVVGLNFFYRDVTDVLEVFSTGAEGSEGPGTFIYSARNSGNGQVYGAEFDLSTSLSAIGLKDTGVFLNYSWLDSKIDDEFGERRFNSQSDYVFNVGFIQDIPAFGAAFGATYRKQGDAESRVVGEEVTTSYGADLEAFLEKRIGGRLTIRLVGSNLLNASKDESFNKFTTVGDQTARNFDEFELESEEAGPVYQLIGRLAF
jgi:hypothetical protein